ncbi:MAG TPA: acyltransferase family protein [Tepidisphaeraceae bacterium]|nr:acyltransferase family protein [Tepidisphaeraceae bacterium]
MTQAGQPERYHALDSLRAIMMLLGVVLHATCAYVPAMQGAWPYLDEQNSDWMGLLPFFVHLFRMPVFFVMAGFFAALLYERRGARSLMVNRCKRILLPLVVGWFLLFPLIKMGFVYALAHEAPSRLAIVWEYCRPGRLYEYANPAHLWFLYDLLYFYAVALLLVKLSDGLGEATRQHGLKLFRRMVQSPWRVVILGLITAATLYPMYNGMLDTPDSFAPNVKTLTAHGVFFAFGWLLYTQADLLPSFRRYAWTKIGLAMLIGVVHLVAMDQLTREETSLWHCIAVGCGAINVWLLIFGITGVFVRYLDRPIYTLRYLTDASYWIYLAHLPLIIWLQGMLANVQISALAKFAVVLAIAVPILIVSYHYGVRATIIGQFLNGRRYPIGKSKEEAHESAPISTN